MPFEETFRHLARDACRFECRTGLQQLEAALVLAEIGAEATLIGFLAPVPVVADKDGDLSRGRADIVECPARGSANLPGVEADITYIAAGGELRDQGEGLYILFRQRLDGAGDDGVFGCNDTENIGCLGELVHPGRDILRREFIDIFDPEPHLMIAHGACRELDRLAEVLVEGTTALQQKYADADLWPCGFQTFLDGAHTIEADSLGRLKNSHDGLFANLIGFMKGAVYGRD